MLQLYERTLFQNFIHNTETNTVNQLITNTGTKPQAGWQISAIGLGSIYRAYPPLPAICSPSLTKTFALQVNNEDLLSSKNNT